MRTESLADPSRLPQRLIAMTESDRTTRALDPYARCEDHCTHDLGAGVLIVELLGDDGPHEPVWSGPVVDGAMVLGLRWRRDEPAA